MPRRLRRQPQVLLPLRTARLAVLTGAGVQGVVAFLPSFSFAEQAEQRWRASRGLQALTALKQVFWEPREASQLEATLGAYSAAALSAGGSTCASHGWQRCSV